jgi:tetratricopeptide (TPR) repeat protein
LLKNINFRAGKSVLRLASLALAASVMSGGAAVAQPVDKAFSDVVTDPSVQNQQVYAGAMIEDGNYEGGIAALEALALSSGNNPVYLVQLGALYYRLESYAAAESYLQAAVNDPRLPEAQRKSTLRLLDDVKRRNSPNGYFRGEATFGVIAQSNPSAGPSGDTYSIGGVSMVVPDSLKADAAIAGYASGYMLHEYDFNLQSDAALVTNASWLARRFSEELAPGQALADPQNIAAVNVTSGVRFKPEVFGSSFSVRPYLGVSEALLGGRQYFVGLGGGVEVEQSLNQGRTKLGMTYDIRRNIYAERGDIANSNEQSGYEQYVQFRINQQVGGSNSIGLAATLRDHNANLGYFGYRSAELNASFTTGYSDPLFSSDLPWYTIAYAGSAIRDYDAADASVDPSRARVDRELRFGVSQSIGLTDKLGLNLGLEYVNTDSNLPNFTYDNVIGSVGIAVRF